jgi:hypothetical protein
MMNMIEEIKETLWIEIRPNSKGLEYLEGVIYKEIKGGPHGNPS